VLRRRRGPTGRPTTSARHGAGAKWLTRWGCRTGWVRRTTAKSRAKYFWAAASLSTNRWDVTAHVIDEEVRRVIDSNYQRAYKNPEIQLDTLQASLRP